ncbi:MAG: hypothetical protein SPF22_08330 [Candidatus Onthovivens sp.]|nr:hypothetical protein [Candidatus Onthovivens sp.]
MLELSKLKEFKVEKQKLKLPKPEDGKGNIIFLPYLSAQDCANTITKTSIMMRQNYWNFIYRDYRYNFKLYNKSIIVNDMEKRNDILYSYQGADKSLRGIKNFTLAKNRNCYIDLSEYMENFFAFRKKNWKNIITEFFSLLSKAISNKDYEIFNRKIILFNIESWDIRKNVALKYSILNNPVAIMYLAMRKDLESIKSIGDIDVLITDGSKSFFKFNPSKLDDKSYMDFKLSMSKVKNNLLNKDLDDDTHLSTYGVTSSDAPREELEKAKKEILGGLTDTSNNEEKEGNKSILDQIADLDDKAKEEIEDMDKEIEDEVEKETDDEDKKKETSKNENDEESEKDIEKELMDELGVADADSAKEVQEILNKRIPDRPISARERILKENQLKLKLDSGKTLKEVLDHAKNNPSYKTIPVTDVSSKVTTSNTNMTKVRFPNFEKVYNEEVMEHDLYATINSLSEKKDLPVYIRKVTKTDTSDSLNLKETYKFELEDPTYKRRHTLTIDVPKFIDNKFMYLAGNKKIFVKQLILKPIVKIAPDTVQICSNYSKIFMFRYGDNISPILQNSLTVFNTNKVFKIKKGNCVGFNGDYKTSIEYDTLAKSFIEIKVGNKVFLFNQKKIDELLDEGKFVKGTEKLDRDKVLIVGYEDIKGGYKALTVDTDAATIASSDFNNGEDLDPIDSADNNSVIDMIFTAASQADPKFNKDEEFKNSGMKISKRYIFSRCKVMNQFVPTVLLLSYCEGLKEVLKKAKVKYSFQNERPRFESNEQKLQTGVIQFADGYLLFDRYPIENSILMNGFSQVDTKAYEFADMENKDTYIDIFGNLYNSRILASAFDSFYDNMIDPITKEILVSMNYPTDFVSLLLVANYLLADNNYSSEIDMNNFRVRSNEMVNGMLYKLVANAFSKYKRTAKNKTPVKISIPPTALITEIVTSQSVEDYSVLSPIVDVAKSHAITSKGPSGINLDQAYTEEKRSFNPTMTGLMSISTSPDGNCGVVRSLTIDPKISSPRGFIDTTTPVESMKDTSLFSMEEMIIPLGADRDDSIRTAMSSKQNKHLIPVTKMDPVLISNGAEKVIAYHTGSDFSIIAEHDGVVENYDEKNNLLIVKYTYKDKGKNVNEYKVINLDSQVNKNGAGGFFLEMKLQPYFKKGEKFKAKDILAADSKFFGNYQDGVKFNIGTLCKVACMSGYNTFEDSTVVSQRLSHKMASDITMEKHVVLGKNANILKIVKPGDKISVNDSLIEFDQSNSDESINKLLSGIDDDLKEKVSNLSRGILRSKYTGYIADVKIYSVSELEELSPSLQKLVSSYWKKIRDKKAVLKKYNITDPTNTGNIFMSEDGPVKPINGKVKGFDIEDGVLIFIYITYHNPFSIGDKLCNFGPLKGVTSEIWDLGKEPYSLYRPNEEISSLFPPGGMLARMVPSVLPNMFGNKLLIELKRHLAEIFYGKPYDYSKDFDGHIDNVPDKVTKR